MERVPPTLDASADDAPGIGGTVVFHLFVGADFECDCAVWAYVLWGVLEEAEYDVFHLQGADSRAGQVVFGVD